MKVRVRELANSRNGTQLSQQNPCEHLLMNNMSSKSERDARCTGLHMVEVEGMSHVNPCPESQSMTDLSREFVRKNSSSRVKQLQETATKGRGKN